MTTLYDKLSKLLTDYEHQENPDDPNVDWEGEFYDMLVEIQNSWEDIKEEVIN